MKNIRILCLVTVLFFMGFDLNVFASTKDGYIKDVSIMLSGKKVKSLSDDDLTTFETVKKDETLKISSSQRVGGIYIIYYVKSSTGKINYDNKTLLIGQNNFLHEFVEIDSNGESIELSFDKQVKIKEIYLFGDTTPEWVQKWNPPYDDADIMLFSAHSDDEHIFFAGLIPSMVNAGKKIQVAYFTVHNKTPIRADEMLEGLWNVGVRNYPVVGIVPDKLSFNLNDAINNLKSTKLSKDDVIRNQVNLIRRFKPEVIVSHDENGEYGHGQHMYCTHSIKEAMKYVGDANYDSDYEPFVPYKVYLHLYKKNQIKMNYNIPLKNFDGKTAFEVSKSGLRAHQSQKKIKWFKWLDYATTDEIKQYNPADFGLYYSSVGYENVDNDMFYKIPLKNNNNLFQSSSSYYPVVDSNTIEKDKVINNSSSIFINILAIVSMSLFIVSIYLIRLVFKK